MTTNNDDGVNVLSLFDGISGAQVALERAGIKVKHYFASEIDKFAIEVTQHHYPNTIQLGDVRNVSAEHLPDIDLLLGGFPCQAFSFAGKQLNFDDARGKLFFEYIRVLEEVQPRYFLAENVNMKKEYQDVINEYIGLEPIEIDSALVSAQSRKRLYWTNIPNVTIPEDRQITWQDVKDNQELEVYRSPHRKLKLLVKYKHPSIAPLTGAVAGIRGERSVTSKQLKKLKAKRKYNIEFRRNQKTNCVTTIEKDNIVTPFALPYKIRHNRFFYRIMTPLELERLQTFPEGYTNMLSKTRAALVLGNSFTVDVIAHILQHTDLKTDTV